MDSANEMQLFFMGLALLVAIIGLGFSHTDKK
jgi:hypothetical protein